MCHGEQISRYCQIIPFTILFFLGSCSQNANKPEVGGINHGARSGRNSNLVQRRSLTIYGVVADSSKKPLAGARVKLQFSQRPGYFYSARTDSTGKYIYRRLQDGFLSTSEVLSLCATSENGGHACKEVTYSRASTLRVHLILEPAPPPSSKPPGACVQEGFSFQTAEGGCRHQRTGVVFGQLQSQQFWAEAFSYCQNLVEGGFDDWNLPTTQALVEVSLPAQGGENSFSFPLETLRLLTNERTVEGSDHAVFIMRSGLPSRTNGYSHSFACIRSGTPWDLPNEIIAPSRGECRAEDHRYQSGEGGCKFLSSGTVFSAISNPLFFTEAQSYCDTLNESGYTDWHLPSIEELRLASLPFQGKIDHLSFSANREAWTNENFTTSSGDRRAVLRLQSGAVTDDGAFSKPTVCVRQGAPETVVPPRKSIPLGACARRGGGFATRNGGCLHSRSRTVYGSKNNPMFISDAQAFCAHLVEGGFEDWFLPAETEMLTITRNSQGRTNHLKFSLNDFYLTSESSSTELQVIHLESGQTELRDGSWAYPFVCIRKY